MSAVAELDAGLQAMQALKPPGVSGSRITALTSLCVANVQSESVLIQKLYTHFKRTPGTHKLGVLYVVDSVTRKWLDQAKQQGQTVNSAAPDGTYAAGVNRVTELIPVLMNDILSTAPADQKDKIRKLVDIWEKGQTFPPKLIESFKERLNATASTTPPGSPPARAPVPGPSRPAAPAAPPAIPPNIMETLANLARQNAANKLAAPAPVPAPAASTSLAFGVPNNNNLPSHLASQLPGGSPYGVQPQPQPQSQPQPFQMPQALSGGNPLLGAGFGGMPGVNGAPMQQPQPQAAAGGANMQNLFLIQALLAQGMPIDQITALLAGMAGGNATVAPAYPNQAAAPPSLVPAALAAAVAASAGGGAHNSNMPPGWPQNGNNNGGYPGTVAPNWSSSANAIGGDDSYGGRSSPGRGRGRSRSRSPGRYYDGRGSPRGRDERRGSPGRGEERHRERGRGRDYRQRSPGGGGRRGGGGDVASPHRSPPAAGDKWVEHDPSLAPGTIRVLSRTLFVGGVTVSEAELRSIFGQYGAVQTCIVNKEKRHAFVKMYTRQDAEAARKGMEVTRNDDSGLRTRWGVGFGPRDCSDYAKGISVIPIAKLTEADRKWLLTAPWGGTGGRAIEGGLVVEEPDIEIGAGVSSKAISRRMQTDRGGANGPRSTRREEELAAASREGGGGRPTRRGGRGGGGGRGDHEGGGANSSNTNSGGNANANANANPNTMFPYGLAMGANGMPVFPQGFPFPANQSGSL